MTIRTWCKHGHLIQRAFGPRRSFRVIPSKRSNEMVRIRSGVEEVGVHGTSSEVVVHVATVVVLGRFEEVLGVIRTCRSCSCDGSHTRFGKDLSFRYEALPVGYLSNPRSRSWRNQWLWRRMVVDVQGHRSGT